MKKFTVRLWKNLQDGDYSTTIVFNEKNGGEDEDIFNILEKPKPKYQSRILQKGEKQKIIANHSVYPHDYIVDLRAKISLALNFTNYPPAALFLWNTKTKQALDYEILQKGPVDLDIFRHMEYTETMLGIPIDIDMYNNRDDTIIRSEEYIKKIEDLYAEDASDISAISVFDIISGHEHEIKSVIQNQPQQFQIFYYGFLIKFFPRISEEMFKAMLFNMHEAQQDYPYALPTQEALLKRYDFEEPIMANIQKKLSTTTFNDIVQGKKFYRTIINNARLSVKTTSQYNTSYKLMIAQNMFNKLTADDKILYVRAKFYEEEKYITLTKINNDKKTVADFGTYREIINLTPIGATSLIIKYTNNVYFMLTVNFNISYTVSVIIKDESEININNIKSIVIKTINPYIDLINKFGRDVFTTNLRLPNITEYNSSFNDINITIKWNHLLSPKKYTAFINHFKTYTSTGFMRYSYENGDVFILSKGLSNYQYLQYCDSYLNNLEYLYKNDVRQAWEAIFTGKYIYPKLDISGISFTIDGLNESDSIFIYCLLQDIIDSFKEDVGKKQEVVSEKKYVIRDLKSKDPELYIFNKYGYNIVYSRKCQKKYQPLAYTPEELEHVGDEDKKRAIKYWNFTTHSDMYYICPNKKFPYLSLLTGVHPKGYCLPCCRKTEPKASVKVDGKRVKIYDLCLQNHVYDIESEGNDKSRYIINFGKKIDKNRLGHLPLKLSLYLNRHLDVDQDSYTEKVEVDGSDVILTTDHIKKIIELSKSNYETIEITTDALTNQTYNGTPLHDIITHPEKYSTLMSCNLINSVSVYVEGLIINPLPILYKFIVTDESVISINVIKLTQDEYLHRVKYSLKKPIEKPKASDEPRKTEKYKDIKQNACYAFGVQQYNLLGYVGVLYSICFLLDLSVGDFIALCTRKMIEKNIDPITFDRGSLYSVFTDSKDFYKHIYHLIEEGTDKKYPNINWNNVFLEMFTACFDIGYVLLQYDGNYKLKTSSKSQYDKYIAILQHDTGSQDNISDQKIFYYPIVVTNIRDFINSVNLSKKIFNTTEPIIQNLLEMQKTTENVFTKFLVETYGVCDNVYYKNYVFANTPNGYFLFNMLSETVTDRVKPISQPLSKIITMLEKYRQWVFAVSKAMGNYRVEKITSVDPLEAEVIPVHDLLRIRKIVCSHQNNNAYFVVLSNNYVYNVTPVDYSFVEGMMKKIPYLFSREFARQNILYNPETINAKYASEVKFITYQEDESAVKIMKEVWETLDKNASAFKKIFEAHEKHMDYKLRFKAIKKVIAELGYKKQNLIASELASVIKADLIKNHINYHVLNYRFRITQTKDNIIYYKVDV